MEKYVMVAGSGISGIGACKLLLQAGKNVLLYDGNPNVDVTAVKEKIGFNTETNLVIALGELTGEIVQNVEYCVISPGISLEAPFVAVLEEENIPIWSEIELAYHYGAGTIAAITGTNGKTTTTSLTGQILEAYYGSNRTFVVGNIGIPYTEKALQMKEDSVVAAEISSFQLESAISFHPHVSAILNITPDHLNRHKTMECYIEVKESITKNQTADDVVVLNYEDKVLRDFGEKLKGPKVIFFSSQRMLKNGLYLQGDSIYWNQGAETVLIGRTGDFHLVGQCNYENIMAAVAITASMGVPMKVIQKVICEFRAVEHRIEFTAVKKGVTYYNDSKGTNPDAAIQGIKAMTTPTVLIGGGYDKGSEYDEWIEAFGEKIKLLILMGQTRDKIAECARKHGFTNIVFVESMEEAVKVAADNAEKGEAVLLSPACASWGMFKNYEQRGCIFKDLVRKLPD
ncbi:MAG: UDP-N-acetylmuramoyl-L-alanine--D-glutamate ligase [Lachnospiraceae bacterium]